MAKPTPIPPKPVAAATAPTIAGNPTPRLNWPVSPKELPKASRQFRMHRMSSFEWQAFVCENGVETPIGKPDLFDLVKGRIAGLMRAEGQREFLEKKTKDELDAQAKSKARDTLK